MITTADPDKEPDKLKQQWQTVFYITAGAFAPFHLAPCTLPFYLNSSQSFGRALRPLGANCAAAKPGLPPSPGIAQLVVC